MKTRNPRPGILLAALLLLSPAVQLVTADEVGVGRDGAITAKRARRQEEATEQRNIIGVRKMSDDEGEKFFFDYWRYEDAQGLGNASGIILPGGLDDAFAASDDRLLRPAFLLHTNGQVEVHQLSRRFYFSPARRALVKRDFKCPPGMSSCDSIGRSDACCGEGDTCEEVEDAEGQSLVGCCPAGRTCSDGIGSCPEGYGSCPSNLGGGCCIPGYECVEGGCKSNPLPTIRRDRTDPAFSQACPFLR